ncbi:MAG: tryptophan 7-halogenase, partial [Pseudomonadota bacterium]
LSVQAPSDGFDGLSIKLGGLESAWQDNAVSIGGAASVHDPLTPGPMVALQRDIERLLDLVPVSETFGMEQREFNRRYKDDSEHTEMFASAFYATVTHDTAFWNDAKSSAHSSGLARKLTQFSSRGVLAKYDLEPFNDEDWTILHHGLGHHAARYDLQAESAPKAEIDRQLDGMSRAIEQLVKRMPPHHLYVANMKRYFEKQKYA